MERKKNVTSSRGCLPKAFIICIYLEAIVRLRSIESFSCAPVIRQRQHPQSDNPLPQKNNLPSYSIGPLYVSSQRPPSSTREEVQQEHDESFLLLQALNPNHNSGGDDGIGNDNKQDGNHDPILSMLLNTDGSNTDRRWQSQQSKPWYDKLSSDQSLPFDCTGCGKCCQTKGEVYLNPNETKNAAAVLNMSIDEFKHKYTSRDITNKKIKDSWTVLKQKRDSEGIEGCIFLDEETKHCSIYEARPLQCSTFPFWPQIMESVDAWNDEVVSNGENSQNEGVWTPEDGGCEGMKKIKVDSEHETIVVRNEDEEDDIPSSGVFIDEAMDRLESYTRYRRAFPL